MCICSDNLKKPNKYNVHSGDYFMQLYERLICRTRDHSITQLPLPAHTSYDYTAAYFLWCI